MAYVFNGVDSIITFDSSTTFLNVQDLWSRYSEWLAISDNSKYLQAMRIVGGDSLPGSKQLGITYFMLNGWKIKPYEESHILTINGNIYSEDGSSPFMAALGVYNVTIINTVSNLVDSTVQQLPEIEYNSFNSKVTLDVANGSAGVAYPLGTFSSPVNNLADAKTIASVRGFNTIEILSDLVITTGENINDLTFTSQNWIGITIEDGVSSDNANFNKISLTGVFGGFWNVLTDCWVYSASNFCGWLRGGSFVEIALAPYNTESLGQSYFDSNLPMYPNEAAILTMNTNTVVSFTNSSDLYEIHSMTDGSVLSFGIGRGKVIIDSSCTGGTIIVSGNGECENNSLLTIYDSGLMNKAGIASEIDETDVKADLEIINNGIKKASLFIPHTQNLT